MTSYSTDGTVGEWAKQKLEILEKYLAAYTTILKNYGFQDYYYIDAFAGEGSSPIRGGAGEETGESLLSLAAAFRAEQPEEAEYIDGSAKIALGIQHPFKKYIFIEKNPDRVAKLKSIKSVSILADRIEILQGDANKEIVNRLFNGINWKRNRGVVLLDPFGLQVPWSTLEKLAQTGALEVIINFPVGMAIQRLLPRNGKFSEEQRLKLSEYFGSSEWESLLYDSSPDLFGEQSTSKVADSGDKLARWYRGRLKYLFGHATLPKLITNQRGGHLYYLIHAGPNPTGVKIANDILMKSARAMR